MEFVSNKTLEIIDKPPGLHEGFCIAGSCLLEFGSFHLPIFSNENSFLTFIRLINKYLVPFSKHLDQIKQ